MAVTTPAFNSFEGQHLPVLYSFRRCPYAMRARLAIAASGLRCELREIVLRSKPPEMLAASPKATVPVLVLPGGQVIEQSLEIMLWSLQQNDPEGWLAPEHGTLQAMQALIAENDGVFKQHLDRYKYPNRYPQEHAGDEQPFAQAHRASAACWLMELETRLGRHACLSGSATSLVDMAICAPVCPYGYGLVFVATLAASERLAAALGVRRGVSAGDGKIPTVAVWAGGHCISIGRSGPGCFY
jgi:glutathione S-transferase